MLAGVPAEGRDGPGQEQLGPGHRVRRVGAGHVEGTGQPGRQRVAEVVLDELGVTPVPAVLAAMQPSTSGSVSSTVSRLMSPGAPIRAANLAIATEIRSSSPRMRIRVPASAPASCMASTRRIFVSTVQCVWSSSGLASGAPAAARSSSPRSAGNLRAGDPAAVAYRAAGMQVALAAREEPAARSGQPHRAAGVHHAALAQLVADRGDDRHGQLGHPADFPGGDRLGPRDRPDHVPDPGGSLGQPDRRRDFGNHGVDIHADVLCLPVRSQAAAFVSARTADRKVSSHIMPGDEAARTYADLRRQEAPTPKMLYAVDATVTPSSPVADVASLTEAATAAVRAGNGHVLEVSHVAFPNDAVTLVLILAESHLSIHTWPEEDLIAIDLFSCGAIDGEAVVAGLVRSLELEDVTIQPVQRGIRAQQAAVQGRVSAR